MSHIPESPEPHRDRGFPAFLILAGAGLFLIDQAARLIIDHRLTPPVLVFTFAAVILLSGIIGAGILAAFDRVWGGRAPARAPARSIALLPAAYAVVLSLALIVTVLLGDLQPPSKRALLGGALVSFLLIMAALAADDHHPWRRRVTGCLILISWIGWSFAGLDRRLLPEPVRLWIMLPGIGLMPAVAWRIAPPLLPARRRLALILLLLVLVWTLDTAGEAVLPVRPPAESIVPARRDKTNLMILAWENPPPLARRDRTAARMVRLQDSSLTEQMVRLTHSLGEQGYETEAVWAGPPPTRALEDLRYFNHRSNPRALSPATGFALHDQLLTSLREELPAAWFEPGLPPRQVSHRVVLRLNSMDPARPWLLIVRFAGPGASPDRPPPAFSWEWPEVKQLLRALEGRALLDHTMIVVIGARPGRTGEVWDLDPARGTAAVSVLLRTTQPVIASRALEAPPDVDFSQFVLAAAGLNHPARFDCPAPPCDNSP